MEFLYNFLADLKNTFIGTNNLMDFRAKLIACMIVVVKDDRPELDTKLKNLVNEMYKDNLKRNFFIAIVKKYITIAKREIIGVDKLLNDIKKIVKKNPKYKKYIDFKRLEKLILTKTINEEKIIEDYSQIRVLEFLKNEVIK